MGAWAGPGREEKGAAEGTGSGGYTYRLLNCLSFTSINPDSPPKLPPHRPWDRATMNPILQMSKVRYKEMK